MTATTPERPRPGGSAALGELQVARIGYGALQLERLHRDRSAAVALVRRAVELGADHIDTAQFYGDGFVNDVLREALHPGDAVVVTKIGADPDPGGPFPMRLAQRPEQLRASVEVNLRTLGLEQLPVVNLRRTEAGSRMQAHGDQLVDLDDQLEVMIALRAEGLIGGIGVSSVDPDSFRRSLAAGIVCVQNPYSVINRRFEDLLQLCADQGVAWVPFFPLGRNYAGGHTVADEPAVQAAAQALDATTSQVGLAWLLHRAPNIMLIPGTASIDHLENNLATGAIQLPPDALDALEALDDE